MSDHENAGAPIPGVDRETVHAWSRELNNFVTDIRSRLHRIASPETALADRSPSAGEGTPRTNLTAGPAADEAAARLRSVKQRLAAQLRFPDDQAAVQCDSNSTTG